MRERPPRPIDDVPEVPADPTIGRTIAGKFAVERRLGAGAMGVVYLAKQLALEKTVAIKVLHRELAVDETFAQRFRREARAASRLDHPNSIRVYDFGEEPDGLLYIAMEYVQGCDLFALISEHGPPPPASVVDLLSQALAALAVAHDLGVLHRDLKPENIMVVRGKGDDGQPVDVIKVCDFGIAKIVESSSQLSDDGGRKHTTKGLIVGTPAYMSPEQARGETLDGRSDLYSMGVVLYELLTGRVPFDGDTPLGIVLKHIGEAPMPPSSFIPSVDRRLEAICMKALQKLPSDRFQDAREMRLALRSALGAAPALQERGSGALLALADTVSATRAHDSSKPTLEGLTPPHSPRPSKRSRPWLVVAVLLPTTAATLIVTLRAGTRAQPPASQPAASQTSVLASPRADEEPRAFRAESVAPTATSALVRVAEVASASGHEAKTHRAKPDVPSPVVGEPPPIQPAPTIANEVAPSATSAPARPAPPPLATQAAPPAPPPAPDPPPPAYDLASARVEIGQATGAIGATSSSVTRAVSEANAQLTSCYRAALPQLARLAGSIEGRGKLHIETDGSGIITDARLSAPLDAVVARCVASAIQGRRVANVDTGSASADVPVVFKAH
jgi:serine/threonine-protein kinase